MNATDVSALLPLLVLAATAVVVLLVIAFFRSHRLVFTLTLAGLAVSFAFLWVAASVAPRSVSPLLVIDRYAIFYTGLIQAAGFAVVLLAFGYLEKQEGRHEEFYVLLLLAALGAAVLASSSHFASFFLGLELLSASLYPLLAYQRQNPLRIEAGLKYLVLAGVSSAFLLLGMALVYENLGTLSLSEIAARAATQAQSSLLLWAGFSLITVGIGFKLALAPFHLWTPDVYQGAPAPVSGFVATVSKGAMFALLLRYFTEANFDQSHSLVVIFTLLAVTSMILGNLLALLQNSIKRLLAYSSIAHLGYLLVALLASGPLAAEAVAYYLVAYFVTTLGAFGVVTLLSDKTADADDLKVYTGLAWRRPWLATALTAAFLSLAGIPLTAGFIGKFYILAAGAKSDLWWLLIVLVATSAVGLFYYLRVIVTLYQQPAPEAKVPPSKLPLPLAGGAALAVLTLLLVWLGIYPAPLVHAIQATLAGWN